MARGPVKRAEKKKSKPRKNEFTLWRLFDEDRSGLKALPSRLLFSSESPVESQIRIAGKQFRRSKNRFFFFLSLMMKSEKESGRGKGKEKRKEKNDIVPTPRVQNNRGNTRKAIVIASHEQHWTVSFGSLTFIVALSHYRLSFLRSLKKIIDVRRCSNDILLSPV